MTPFSEPIMVAKGMPQLSAQTGRTTSVNIFWPARATGSVGVGGISGNVGGKTDSDIDRLHPVDPVAEEAPRFFDRLAADRLLDWSSPTGLMPFGGRGNNRAGERRCAGPL